jgi:hypothetical protein
MKPLCLLVIAFLFSGLSFSQSLEGEWRGSFTDATIAESKTPFALYFKLEKDSSYTVYTYTQTYEAWDGAYLTVVCQATCNIISTDSVLIEEFKQVKPKSSQDPGFQKLHLVIRTQDNKRIMEGWWEWVDNKYGGTILLTKR